MNEKFIVQNFEEKKSKSKIKKKNHNLFSGWVRSQYTSDKTATLVLTVTFQYQNQNVKPSWIMLQQDNAAGSDDNRNSGCKANSQPLI